MEHTQPDWAELTPPKDLREALFIPSLEDGWIDGPHKKFTGRITIENTQLKIVHEIVDDMIQSITFEGAGL